VSLEDRILDIVKRSDRGQTIEALSQAYAKDIEKEIKAALDGLAGRGVIKKNQGASIYLTTYHRIHLDRRI
jgi:hypothetical protein